MRAPTPCSKAGHTDWRKNDPLTQRKLRDSFLSIIEKNRVGRPKLVATWMQWMYCEMRNHVGSEVARASHRDLAAVACHCVLLILKVGRTRSTLKGVVLKRGSRGQSFLRLYASNMAFQFANMSD